MRFTKAESKQVADELVTAQKRIVELEDLARNVAGLDMRLINSFDTIRATTIEWREQAQRLLS